MMSEDFYEPEFKIGKTHYKPEADAIIKIAGVGTFGCNIIHDFIFINLTFSDLKEERNALEERVFRSYVRDATDEVPL